MEDGVPGITQANLHAIQSTMEAAGVVFLPDGFVGLVPQSQGYTPSGGITAKKVAKDA